MTIFGDDTGAAALPLTVSLEVAAAIGFGTGEFGTAFVLGDAGTLEDNAGALVEVAKVSFWTVEVGDEDRVAGGGAAVFAGDRGAEAAVGGDMAVGLGEDG